MVDALLWLVFLGAPSVPILRDPAAIVRALETRYHAARTLKATFLERYTAGRNDTRVESGTVYFSRPGRMRWEYEAPETKLFVADGTHVWFYVPVDRTVTRATMKQSMDWRTPLALLAGKARLSRICGRVELLRPGAVEGAVLNAATGNVILRCLPRGESTGPPKSAGAPRGGFREIQLEADAAYRLVRVLIRELAGVETEFRFANWQENIRLPEAMFHFQAPPGVAIVDESDLLPQAKGEEARRSR